MKKTNIQPRQEIKSQDIQNMNDYLEEAIGLFTSDVLQITEGIIIGLGVTQNVGFNSKTTVAIGSLYDNRVFGELETPKILDITLPPSGTKTDLIVASYEEITDTPDTGYVLLDTETRIESIENFDTRKMGSVKVELLENTTIAGLPANKFALAEIVSDNTGITSVVDKRAFSVVGGLNGENIQISGSNPTKIKAYVDAIIASKGQANGIATLGSDAKLDPDQVPTITTSMLGANAVTNIVHATAASAGSAPTGAYANITGFSLSITISAGSTLMVSMSVSDITVSNGSTTSIYACAFNCNAADYDIGSLRSSPTYTSGSGAISGTRVITGLPAGTYTIQGRHRQANGGTSMVATGNGICTLTAIEIKK